MTTLDSEAGGDASASGYGGFCCAAKQHLLYKNEYVTSLEIIPRVVICRKKLRPNDAYEQSIRIKNMASSPRFLKIYTDSPQDTTLCVTEYYRHRYLGPDETLNIEILISATDKANINRRRHVYVESEHPTIKFEIPIIVIGKGAQPSIPDIMVFPRSLIKSWSSYEMIIYNPTLQSISVVIKTVLPGLNIMLSSKNAEKKDYIKVLFKLRIKDSKDMHGELKIKFDTSSYITLPMEHKPIRSALFIGASHVEFETLAFERESKKNFRICNESIEPLNYSFDFLTEHMDASDLNSLHGDQETLDEVELSGQVTVESFELDDTAAPVINTVESFDSVKYDVPKDKYDVIAYKHFSMPQPQGTVEPNSSKVVTVVFHPRLNAETDFAEALQPPYVLRTKIFLNIPEEKSLEKKFVTIVGFVRGPEMEFTPKMIDVRKIYLGEEHCFLIKVLNVDGLVNAKVYFADYVGKKDVNVTITPEEGFYLEPCQRGIFNLRIFTLTVGKFMAKLKFKVKNGNVYNIVVKGISQTVRVKTFPDILEFGSIPVAVPQKRYVLIMNPLTVPITVQCTAAEDGDETPLILNIRDIDEYLPITVKDPIKQLAEMRESFNIEDCPSVRLTSREQSEISFQSVHEDNSSYSTSFEEEILDPIHDFATEVIANIRQKKFLEKSEVEKRFLLEAMDTLMATNYFSDFGKHNNYAYMDWNALPMDPKEIYCDNEIIYLKPNTGKTITVLVIPNNVGYHNRAVDIRVCPINEYFSDDVKTNTLVRSELMISKLWIEYDCRIPDIRWQDTINFNEQTVYAGEEYEFEFEFQNYSNVGGFVYFDIIPSSADGVMRLVNNLWKFYVSADSDEYAFCSVRFGKIGSVVLTGVIKYVGKIAGMQFHLTADVLPAKIRVTPLSLYNRQNVMEYTRFHFYIDNLTPTDTWLTASLKYDRYQFIEPMGAILNSEGQGMYVTLHSKFYDPELYRNILYIDLQYGAKLEIPISILVEGMPIYFDPNIKDGFDGGIILTNSKENFYDKKPNFSKLIKVTNLGERCYQLLISKLKSSLRICGVDTVMSRIIVTPKMIMLEPGDVKFIHITANAFEDTTVYNEFRVQIMDQTNKQRFHNIRFSVTATFIQPELNWNRRFICFDYNRTHKFKEYDQTATVQLKNIADVEIESVNLKVLGPFKIKEGYARDGYVKELDFKIDGLEKKEFLILLIRPALKNKYCTFMEGRIICTANERVQKAVNLKVNINNPEIVISQPELIIFAKYSERNINVEIENVGCLEAQYKWKKLDEITEFIGEYDDVYEFAHEILSDLFRMLDISEEESDWEDIDHPNMTLRYQRFVCKLKRLEDPIGVASIIDEIIDNLDFEHKRYMIKLDEAIGENASLDCSEDHSTGYCVKKTVNKIINLLKLEDSFNISEVSSDDCMKERTVYFYEKSGTLREKEVAQCMLHLPGVRTGYATTASFLLEIVGANTQKFNITLVNIENTIELSRDNIYLGMKPWYELYKTNIRIRNVTQYAINIRIEEIQEHKSKQQRISDGYVWISSARFFNIPTSCSKLIKAEGVMGFSDEFVRDIRVIVNDVEKTQIRVRGQGIMPMLSMASTLGRVEKDPIVVIEEYELLKRVYHFEVFKGITADDSDLMDNGEEGVQESSSFVIDISQRSSASSLSTRASERRFFKLMKTYVLVNHNEELPNATVLEQLLETEKFLQRLKVNADTCLLLHLVYKEYIKMLKCYDERMPVNLKYFTTQPLPFQTEEFLLNMNELKMNQFRRFEIKLQFFGPGKLIAAARTAVKIPGLTVDFEISESEDKDFIFYTAAEDKAPDFFQKRYRNLYEREIDLDINPKLKHAHSFDVKGNKGHQREVSTKERKNIYNYYNSLNKSVYLEHKHHFVLSKIFSNSKQNFSGTHLSVILLFKPEQVFYDDGQLLEDYLYIDLHMGPTLPILLRGMVSN